VEVCEILLPSSQGIMRKKRRKLKKSRERRWKKYAKNTRI